MWSTISAAWRRLRAAATWAGTEFYIQSLLEREEELTLRIRHLSRTNQPAFETWKKLESVRTELIGLGFSHIDLREDNPNICPHDYDYDECPQCNH